MVAKEVIELITVENVMMETNLQPKIRVSGMSLGCTTLACTRTPQEPFSRVVMALNAVNVLYKNPLLKKISTLNPTPGRIHRIQRVFGVH